MSVNWSNIGSTLSGLTAALTNLGVSATTMPSILASIGAASNPDRNEELAICLQIMTFAANPAEVAALAQKLALEIGIPADAAAAALQLTAPGVDMDAKALEIEQLIKAGG